MSFVLRKINPRGLSAMAHEATAAKLAAAAISGDVQMGEYLEWSDPDANNGMGADRWTTDINKAKRFPSLVEAMACWTEQSSVRPFRDDGEPNKPLTAWSVTVESAP